MEEEKKDTSSTPETIDGTVVENAQSTPAVQESVAPAKASNMKVLLTGLIGALVVGALVFGGYILSQVKKLSSAPIVLKSAEILHLPAVKVEGATLLYVDYINDLQALKKLSTNPSFSFGPSSDQDLSDLVVANFMTNHKTNELAKQFNLSVPQAEIDQKKTELVSQFGEEQVKKSIEESYGWDVDTFIKKIIQPSILSAKVKEAYEKNTDPTTTPDSRQEANVSHILVKVNNFQDAKEVKTKKAKTNMILARLKKGEDFAKLAKEFSDDPSKDQGGSLGWVPRGGTVAPFDQVAFSLELKKISDVVETSYGFHLIKVDERRSLADFESFMDNEVKKMKPEFFIPIHNPLNVATTTPSADAGPQDAAPAPTK